MDIQILNIAELLLFVFMICTCIRIYRQKKQKGKISLKTLIMFLINLIFYVMVTGTNYHRTHPGESKFQAGITYNNVRIFIYSIVFCLGLAIMKKMKKLASKWIITWAILCTVFLIVMSFCEIENAYVSFSTADQAEKYYGIEKNKIDIYDIPIVLITEQYLEYVNQMDHEDLDVVSDFLVMAATLLDIKSRMLLPKVEKEEEEDEEDPRAELVRRLLEYKMYKYMAQELEEREQEAELLFFKEPTIPREVAKYEEPLDLDKLLDGLTLAKLQKVFDAVMKRNANKLDPVRSRFSTIRREPISLEQKVKSVLSYAREHRHFKFSDVLERESDRLEIVVAFLAVLELMKMGRIHLVQEKLFDEMQLDTVDVDETEGEAELELSTEEGEEYARIR